VSAPGLEIRARSALAEVEAQRDDAVAYLSAARGILNVLARGGGVRACAQESAETLVTELRVEACAVVLREISGGTTWVAGLASQADRLSGPSAAVVETAWLALAGLVGHASTPVCFRRDADGGFETTPLCELRSEGFVVLPLALDDRPGGALVLQMLTAPAQAFARGSALTLLADLVASAVVVARGRDASGWVCDKLSAELGEAHRALGEHAETLRARDAHIAALVQELLRVNLGSR
jgi:hypothetical protein